MTHGGKRPGAGRKKENNVVYYRRVNPEFVEKLDECLSKLKTNTFAEWKGSEMQYKNRFGEWMCMDYPDTEYRLKPKSKE